jgi:hypothetical protein
MEGSRIMRLGNLISRAHLMAIVTGIVILAFVSDVSLDASEPLSQHLQTHCVRCHGEKKAKGGLNLSQLLGEQPLIKNREQWNHVIDLVKAGEMPPEDEEQPTVDQRGEILFHLDQSLNHFDFSSLDNPGFESARRLTNQEYNRTISDLLGISLSLADRFPADLTGASGFENSANTLFLEASRMERYIAAAERAAEAALPSLGLAEKQPDSFQRIMVQLPDESVTPSSAAAAIIEQFLLRAYRRPPSVEERAQGLKHFHSNFEKEGHSSSFVDGIRQVVQATLISPKFLLRVEKGSQSNEAYKINDFELASRLSYFLWATMPDAELFDLASKNLLHLPETLEAQVDRMLAHPYADEMGSTFAAQWLGFRFMGNRVRLDPIDNPWCTDSLMNAMREESGLFFASLVREDRPIDDLVAANYTFLNEELADEIYGMKDVKGAQMRRVVFENPNRGGILTHGSLMAITSNHKETSPIKRGNWILETVLGRPLPPPPPNAGAFKEDVEENDSLTFRQKVELHSSDPSCRNCHSKIDPLGFSLENFDYFGRWRESYRVRVVERKDKETLSLLKTMRALTKVRLYERIEDLDSGPDARMEIRDQLNKLRKLDQDALHAEVTQIMTASLQNRLIRLLERLEIDPFGSDPRGLLRKMTAGIEALKKMDRQEIASTLNSNELEIDEQQEVQGFISEIRAIPEKRIEQVLKEFEREEREEVIEVLEVMHLIERDKNREERRRRPKFERKAITGKATLPDGTPFRGPAGLKEVILSHHKKDLTRQLISKMLAYALGRQLEYYDEQAIRSIVTQMENNDYRMRTLIKGIVDSYPFQFKKNPQSESEL